MSEESGTQTTYKYASLMRCKGGNRAWNDEDGDKSVVMGKQPETWMPRVIVETEDGKDVIGTCYKREALVQLPEWMTHEDASEWIQENLEHIPDGFEEFYADTEVAEA